MNPARLTLAALALVCAACAPAAQTASPSAMDTPTPRPAATADSTLPPPTLTSTPAPAARLFTENFDSTPANWVSFQTSGAGLDLQVQDGFLLFNLRGPNNWAYAIYSGQDYAEVRLEAALENRAAEDSVLGLICHYGEGQGWYEFNVYADRTYMLLYGEWLGEGSARYTPLYRGFSEKIQAGGSNQLGLLCQGRTLTPFVNGVQLRKWDEKQFGLVSGRIGIAAASFEAVPVVAAIDWLTVGEP